MADLIKKQEGVLKKLSRRNWLRNAAIMATSAVMLFLTGCTKEQWDNVKGHVPGGGSVGGEQDTWYKLKVTYYPDPLWAMTRVDYMGQIDDYMIIGNQYKFRLYPGQNGFNYLQLEDGSWMNLTYSGWAYSSSEEDRVGWKIVDGKMYSNYTRWKDYPLGCQWREPLAGFKAYYVGVNFGDHYVLTNCEFVPAP